MFRVRGLQSDFPGSLDLMQRIGFIAYPDFQVLESVHCLSLRMRKYTFGKATLRAADAVGIWRPY